MENEQGICPICGSKIINKVIDYSDWNDGHLLVVRSVPVHECEENGHRFFRPKLLVL
jgi:YgiT-type zinc finger domain-containing protein